MHKLQKNAFFDVTSVIYFVIKHGISYVKVPTHSLTRSKEVFWGPWCSNRSVVWVQVIVRCECVSFCVLLLAFRKVNIACTFKNPVRIVLLYD